MTKDNTIWVKTKSGTTITMILPDAKFIFSGSWKEIKVTSTQFKWIQRQSRFLDISSTNPNKVQNIEAKYPLQDFELSDYNLKIVKGDNVLVKISYIPKETDTTQFNPILRSSNPKIVNAVVLSDYEISVESQNIGTAILEVFVGSWSKELKVEVVGEPRFVSPEFQGIVGEPIELDLINAEGVALTVPEHVKIVEGTTVVAEESGIYTIIASCMGRTFVTKLNVVQQKQEESDSNVGE